MKRMKINQKMISGVKLIVFKFICLLALFPFVINANDLSELKLIGGTWKCEKDYHGD